MLVAARLRTGGKYEEALRWLRSIFDPTSGNTDYPTPQRYWRVAPFMESGDDAVNTWAAYVGTATDGDAVATFIAQLSQWLDEPFDPHAIAALRPVAYKRAALFAWLDTLMAWADSLYSRDTMESVGEASQLYTYVADLLGPEPAQLDATQAATPWTWTSLLSSQATAIDDLDEIESSLSAAIESAFSGVDVALPMLPPAWAFCLPANAHMLSYWDTVQDRLFKLRHCQDIDGRYRTLNLFSPPLDPALLVAAAAAGLSLSSILSATSTPLPPYRLSVMLERAKAFTATLGSLGQALQGALERRDGEELALLRAEHEVALLQTGRWVLERRVSEAKATISSLEVARAAASARKSYYLGLLKKGKLEQERVQISLVRASLVPQLAAMRYHLRASDASLVPRIHAQAAASGTSWGSGEIASSMGSLAAAASTLSGSLNTEASTQGLQAGYLRRKEEWKNQKRQASLDRKRISKDLVAARIRLAITKRQLQDHDAQIDRARQVRELMESKYTNQELYDWLVGELSSLYYSGYQLAVDIARRAEACYRWELGDASASFIGFSHWDGLRDGLLAGERLGQELQQLESSMLADNSREYELTRYLSLDAIDPIALLQLRESGECSFTTSEVLFDLDFPGHYLRRIKSISITVPCVTGGYLGVNTELSFAGGSTRTTASTAASLDSDADRGGDTIPLVICTSTGDDDSGLFQPSLDAPRYLPFEGRGVIGTWTLRLTSPYPDWDPTSIADVVMKIRYTARDGGTAFHDDVVASLPGLLDLLPSAMSSDPGPRRAFLLSRDFPDEWAAFFEVATTAPEHRATLAIDEQQLPADVLAAGGSIEAMEIYLVPAEGVTYTTPTPTPTAAWLGVQVDGGAVSKLLPDPTGSVVGGLPFASQSVTGAVLPMSVDLSVDQADIGSTGLESSGTQDPAKLQDIILVFRFSVP